MTVKVLLFARARDLAGSGELTLELPASSTVASLREALKEAVPALQPLLPRLHIAVNNDYASEADVIPPHAEVACFPPVSGG
jgi:molybdopterin converting factor subunit 1